jgi:hypothetical protein
MNLRVSGELSAIWKHFSEQPSERPAESREVVISERGFSKFPVGDKAVYQAETLEVCLSGRSNETLWSTDCGLT